jgi:hypothetical protein
MEPLDAAAVETDVVARPQDAELLAPGRQRADQIREPAVVPVPAGLATQIRTNLSRDSRAFVLAETAAVRCNLAFAVLRRGGEWPAGSTS